MQGDIYHYTPGQPLDCVEYGPKAPLWDGLRISDVDFLHFTFAD